MSLKLTATQFFTVEDKEKFITRFKRFVEGGFKSSAFTQEFYRQISMCRGHIAHYNRTGFYAEWFDSTQRQLQFLQYWRNRTVYGDPAFTFSDVERLLQGWIMENGFVEQYEEKLRIEIRERELEHLRALKAKYPEA